VQVYVCVEVYRVRNDCSIFARLLNVGRVNSDLLVVLLQRSEILPGFGKLTLHDKLVQAAGMNLMLDLTSSMPSPTYQWTKARFEYRRSNLWSSRLHAVEIAVVFESMQTLRVTFARSPPGT
jgi:hypothetical protein